MPECKAVCQICGAIFPVQQEGDENKFRVITTTNLTGKGDWRDFCEHKKLTITCEYDYKINS